MDGEKQKLPSEEKGSIKEAIGKLTGDRAAEAEGAAEVKAARARRKAADSHDSPAQQTESGDNGT